MLLLKRRRGQVLKIGPDVEVKVVRIEHGAVELGVTCPSGFKIDRPAQDAADALCSGCSQRMDPAVIE